MIYKTLRKIPMITLIEIIDDLDITRLSDEKTPIEELVSIWEVMYQEYQDKYNKQNSQKVFSLSKEIEFLEKKYVVIKCAVEALKFDVHQELIDMLLDYGYRFNQQNYNEDLLRVERECEGIIQKINILKNSLPKEEKSNTDSAGTIINVMASYSSILGYDFDFYTVSVEKFYSLENQVKQKVAAIEKQNAKKK
ncbi:MAG: hypothetical protein V4683_11850 [Bacteroidota bacterium]